MEKIKPKENELRGRVFEKDTWIDTNDLEDSLDFQYDEEGEFTQPTPPLNKCIYCGADWTPEMVELLTESGYCETCYNTDSFGAIICSKCKRIVYRK